MSKPWSPLCLLCTFTRSVGRSQLARRKFHSSASHGAQNKPISEAGLTAKKLPRFGKKERERLAEKYTPAQLEAIEAGEEAIDPEHLASQASHRLNHWSLRYLDDLSKIDPVVDHPIRAPYSNTDEDLRLKTEDELDEDLAGLIADLPENEDSPEAARAFLDFDKNLRLTVGKEEGERNARSAEAPDLFRPGEENLDGKVLQYPSVGNPQTGPQSRPVTEDVDPGMLRLMQMTGLTRRQISSLRVKSIVQRRVANMTHLGKMYKICYLTVAGNGKGSVGIGEGKNTDAGEARAQSQYRAISSMQPIMRYEGRTIFGDVKGKVSGTELELFSRPPGFGLRCQHHIWEICRCAGIADLAARVGRSRNPMNTAKAAMKALLSQKDPEEIARARGKKMVDVRKVYYAGGV